METSRRSVGGLSLSGFSAAVLDTTQEEAVRKRWSLQRPGSQRRYRAVEIDSGLRCVLGVDSDAEATVNVAATVGAGQLRDSPGYDGLSHLTEHLTMARLEGTVFALDTQAFANAFTGFDRTTYFASCDAKHWRSLVRAFARAFPVRQDFDVATARRELLRVDAELLTASSPRAREFDLLVRRAALSCDPLARFGPGSKESLLGDGTFADLVRAADNLYETRYQARDACLAVILGGGGKESLDDLEKVVADAFKASFPRRQRRSELQPLFPPPMMPSSDDLQLLVTGPASASAMVPQECTFPRRPTRTGLSTQQPKKTGTLVAVWKIPYNEVGGFEAFELCKPHVIAAHLVGHGGPQTISSALTERRLVPVKDRRAGVPALTAGAMLSGDRETGFCVFEVRAPFYDDDEETVLRTVDAGLEALRRWPRTSFIDAAADCLCLADVLAWRLPPREPTATEIANDMRKSPETPDGYLSRARRIFASPADAGFATQRFLRLLDLTDARVAVLYEPRAVADIDQDTIRAARQEDSSSSAFFSAPSWPRRNRYAAAAYVAPTRQPLKTTVSLVSAGPQVWHAPSRWHLTTGRLEAWAPPAYVSVVLLLPRVAADPDLRLAIQRRLAEPLYDAVLAGHKYELTFVNNGVRIALAGIASAAFDDFLLDYATRLTLCLGGGGGGGEDLGFGPDNDSSEEAVALVAGDVDASQASNLVSTLVDALLDPTDPRRGDRSRRSPTTSLPPALLRPAYWDHPVAQNLGIASGVPTLVPGSSSRFEI